MDGPAAVQAALQQLLDEQARREHDYMCEIVGLRSQVEGLSEDLDKLRCLNAELQQRVQQLQQSAPQVTHQPSAARQGRDKTQLYRTKYYKYKLLYLGQPQLCRKCAQPVGAAQRTAPAVTPGRAGRRESASPSASVSPQLLALPGTPDSHLQQSPDAAQAHAAAVQHPAGAPAVAEQAAAPASVLLQAPVTTGPVETSPKVGGSSHDPRSHVQRVLLYSPAKVAGPGPLPQDQPQLQQGDADLVWCVPETLLPGYGGDALMMISEHTREASPAAEQRPSPQGLAGDVSLPQGADAVSGNSGRDTPAAVSPAAPAAAEAHGGLDKQSAQAGEPGVQRGAKASVSLGQGPGVRAGPPSNYIEQPVHGTKTTGSDNPVTSKQDSSAPANMAPAGQQPASPSRPVSAQPPPVIVIDNSPEIPARHVSHSDRAALSRDVAMHTASDAQAAPSRPADEAVVATLVGSPASAQGGASLARAAPPCGNPAASPPSASTQRRKLPKALVERSPLAKLARSPAGKGRSPRSPAGKGRSPRKVSASSPAAAARATTGGQPRAPRESSSPQSHGAAAQPAAAGSGSPNGSGRAVGSAVYTAGEFKSKRPAAKALHTAQPHALPPVQTSLLRYNGLFKKKGGSGAGSGSDASQGVPAAEEQVSKRARIHNWHGPDRSQSQSQAAADQSAPVGVTAPVISAPIRPERAGAPSKSARGGATAMHIDLDLDGAPAAPTTAPTTRPTAQAARPAAAAATTVPVKAASGSAVMQGASVRSPAARVRPHGTAVADNKRREQRPAGDAAGTGEASHAPPPGFKSRRRQVGDGWDAAPGAAGAAKAASRAVVTAALVAVPAAQQQESAATAAQPAAAADRQQDVPAPITIPCVVQPVAARPGTSNIAVASDMETERDVQGLRPVKYTEVVRGKAREQLQGYACQQCREFYEAMVSWQRGGANGACGAEAAAAALRPTCGHAPPPQAAAAAAPLDPLAAAAAAATPPGAQLIQANSRHRAQWVPPQGTPDGFWSLTFPDNSLVSSPA